MILKDAQVQAYLARIEYHGSLAASLDNLRALQRAHVFPVPFENLDIHLGRHMPVEVEHAFKKVVAKKRGGFCYELNPLFHALLTTLGYDATIISARILLRGDGHPFDHIATVVHFDDDWLVDVGYGRQPPVLRIALDAETSNENGNFKLKTLEGEYVVLGSTDNGDFEPSYGFSLAARNLREFDERSKWIQTSPDSIFTKTPVCTMPTGDGRATISGLNFIRHKQDEVVKRKVTTDERDEILKSIFGIDLGDEKLPAKSDLEWIPGRGL